MTSTVLIDRIEKLASHSERTSSENSSILSPERLNHGGDPDITSLPTMLSVPQTPLTPASSSVEPAPAVPTDGNFPDGGWAAWSVVSGSWCGQFCSLGWLSCLGVLQTQYEREQLRHYSSSNIAWIMSLQTFLTFAGAPFFGRIFDSHGPRGMMLFGIMVHMLGLMTVSVSTKYWHFMLAQSVCSGVGAGAIVYASLNSVSTWFRERRAVALGLASSGSGVGGVVIPIMFNKLKPTIGFGWTIRCIAFMFLGLLILSSITVRSRLKPNPQPWRLADFLHPLKDWRFVSMTGASFAFHLAFYLPLNYITLQALDEGMSENLAGYLISIINAAGVLGRVLLGRVADKAGRFNCLVASASVSALLVLVVWLPGHGNAAIIVFSALVGFSIGGYISLLPACVAQVADIQRIGVYNGLNWVFAAAGTLIGTPVGGALIKQLDDGKRLYSHMQIFTGVAMWVGVLLYIVARTVQAGLPTRI